MLSQIKQDLSIDQHTLELAMERARELNLSFSDYVALMIQSDVKERGPFVVKTEFVEKYPPLH